VTYNTQGFLEKNKDALTPDILRLMGSSKSELIKGKFFPERVL
jgi:myosin heavy subunit